jgi:hypothetical protein
MKFSGAVPMSSSQQISAGNAGKISEYRTPRYGETEGGHDVRA